MKKFVKTSLFSALAAAAAALAPAAALTALPAAAAQAAQAGAEEAYANFTGAVKNNRADVVKKMLDQGYNPNVKMPNGDPALVYAIRADNDRVIPLLLKAKGIDVDKANASGESALMVAAYKKNRTLVNELLAKGAIVDRSSGWSPLHYAAAAGSPELVDLFLKKGANPNVRTKSGVTPLFMAARIANRACIERLLKAGARKDLCNDRGQSPADMVKANTTTLDTKLIDLLATSKCAK
ncbi:ankyrin repeat domain-containing protein [Mesosutterella sp. AGMB02718]|uniref:Ankyrin repeat domain-containing protein n=1 Tax=Mesosutterella faecium TaxID=2925194 RepID=A0ABT7IMG7_9BURK|nr:ankyrin repeat domain-containing protein [Mesosutterella sp. AGMB02718]MDL2059558.1 ankyrin repeat domain-containing protein [Mesosutterella sp. AGMB02718]